MFLIQTFFDFSKYDLLMLQIQQMTIFCSLQPIKYLETLKFCIIIWNTAFWVFLFLKKNTVIIWEVCSIKFELYWLTVHYYLGKTEQSVICIIMWNTVYIYMYMSMLISYYSPHGIRPLSLMVRISFRVLVSTRHHGAVTHKDAVCYTEVNGTVTMHQGLWST